MKRAALGAWIAIGIGACGSSHGPTGPTYASPDDLISSIKASPSCALDCANGAPCNEATHPWTCPALADWNALPHAASCPAYEPSPPASKGACVATDPAGDALAKASPTSNPPILPDGRRVAAAGTEWAFDEADLDGGFSAASALVPGTKWLVVVDAAYGSDAVRVVDTTMLRAGAPKPVASYIRYPVPQTLAYGVAVSPTTSTVYVAGGPPDSRVYAFDVDAASGKITENTARDVALPNGAVPQGLDVSGDGKTLIVGQGLDTKVLVYSLDPASYGKSKGAIDVGDDDVFAVRFDPNDPAGGTAWATMWTSAVAPANPSTMRFVRLDVGALASHVIPVGKSPEEIAFLDARFVVVANALSDTLSIVDRTTGKVTSELPVTADPAIAHGAGPSALAWDAPRKRLYVALSTLNGVAAYDVDLGGASPTLTPAGIFTTAWWPTSIAVDPADGAVFVTTGKGHGTGTDHVPSGFLDGGDVSDLVRGSVQAVPYMDASALAAATATFQTATNPAKITGYPTVQCNGAPYDFPIPEKPEDGPSKIIKHVVFVVRENKTFDALLGDLPGLDGDPTQVLAAGHQDDIWPNTRKIAQAFAHMDNFYSDAEQSIQGHAWTVMGRTTDYEERRWVVIWGRSLYGPELSGGVGGNTTPAEGNIFDVLKTSNTVQNFGDLYALGYRDTQWPGGGTETPVPDTLGACYFVARAKSACDAPDFSYVWLPNDHTWGLAANMPNPGISTATNDEATGMLLDGISRSPMWKDTLVVVVEDDPSTGADHVDLHRTIALFASPWVKRGYVSHAHYDVPSVHKLFAHIFGRPYWNETIARAPLPLDVFSSTPDYTPFTYVPRKYGDLSCNPSGTTGSKEAEGWDFSEPDDQPGLARQTQEYFRSLPKP